MKLKKIIALSLIAIGLLFLFRAVQFYHRSKIWEEIHQFGQTVDATVITVDCENNDEVIFKIDKRKEPLKLNLESDCNLFDIGKEVAFLHYDKYPDEYIFRNSHISDLAIIVGFGLSIPFFIVGGFLLKEPNS